MTRSPSLLETFIQRQAELKRYFTARVGETEAEDLVQETYLKVAAITDESDIRNYGAYLYRLGNNVMVDRLRQHRASVARDDEWRRTTRLIAPSGEEVLDAVPVDQALVARDRLRHVCDALEELPDTVRATFRRHKFDGLSYAEVAEEFGVSRSLVEKHMMRALKHLIARVG